MKMGSGVIGFQMIVIACVVVVGMMIMAGVAGEVHHVVGGDRGWDPTSDLVSWSSGRVFRVGDQIWFTYSAAQGLVAELKSREEYESCDVSNPIKMYTEGLHTLPLEREGIRYFASSEPENCKNGLKLHVEVLPKDSPSPSPTTLTVQAAGPTTPSSSASYGHSTTLALMVMLFCFCVTIMGLAY